MRVELEARAKQHLRDLGETRARRLLRVACIMAIVGLMMMLWSIADPRPAPVLLALSLGQLIGTLSFVTFLVIVAWDVYRAWRARRTRSS